MDQWLTDSQSQRTDAGWTVPLVTSTNADGTFVATATTVYYTWNASYDSDSKTYTRNGTTTGIVPLNGSVLQQPLPNSTFLGAVEASPWPPIQ